MKYIVIIYILGVNPVNDTVLEYKKESFDTLPACNQFRLGEEVQEITKAYLRMDIVDTAWHECAQDWPDVKEIGV